MRLLFINTISGYGSTGKICLGLAKEYERLGYEVKIAYGREPVSDDSKKYSVRIGNDLDMKVHGIISRVLDNQGLNSKRETRKFLEWADGFNPDLLWLHNIHGYYLNYVDLFEWIKSRPDMEVRWTLHDCWAFTGHCSYFSMVNCEGWKTGCSGCKHKYLYPKSLFFSNAEKNFTIKKKCFMGVKRMKIITPSQWLAGLVKNSFLGEYDVEVKYNSIDKNVFKPTESMFREENQLCDKKIVLGVADGFGRRKGLADFVKLSQMLPENYTVVLVGLTEKEMDVIPTTILGIKRTRNVEELVKIYSAADVYVNATYEDNYPTTNLEAQACGTPCITYRAGGSPESVPQENVVEIGDIENLKKRIIELTS